MYALAPGKGLESNQYSYPLPFSPLYDEYLEKVVSLEPMGTGGLHDGLSLNTAGASPMTHCVPNEYHRDLQDEPERTDLKPLHVVQPQGASFEVTDSNCVSWQKWR